MLNSKGHVPTILLFVVGLVLALTAWFTFLGFNESIAGKSADIAEAIALVEHDEDYVRELSERLVLRTIAETDSENFEASFEEAFVVSTANVDRVGDVSGNFFGKVRNEEFSLLLEEDIYVLQIDSVFVQSRIGGNVLRREFDLIIRFNEGGLV